MVDVAYALVRTPHRGGFVELGAADVDAAAGGAQVEERAAAVY